MKTIKKNVSEPWFSLIKLGLKTVEGRLNKGDFQNLRRNDIIIWTNDELGFIREFRVRITSIREFNNFKSYLETEGLNRCLPGIDNIDEGLKIYYRYFTKNQENEFGILVIRMKID